MVDNRGGKGPKDAVRVQTVGAPIVPSGDIAIVQGPVILANTQEMDPSNPANAPRQEFYHPDKSRREAQAELTDLLRKGPHHPDYNAERVFDLHYLVNGEQPPAR